MAQEQPEAVSEQKTRVVIIDDEPETVELLVAYFKLIKLEAYGAFTGKTGLKAIAEHHPNVVVLDLMLPDMDGFVICEELRKDPATAKLPVVILSARTSREDVRRGYAAGATRYLKKPVDLDRLATEVKRVAASGEHKPPTEEQQQADATARSS